VILALRSTPIPITIRLGRIVKATKRLRYLARLVIDKDEYEDEVNIYTYIT
jgi:hypothetical protein